MSQQNPPEPAGEQLSEEQLAALEAEMELITVDDVLLQTIVSLVNLGARKGGLVQTPGRPPAEPDLPQMAQAIEGARALMPVVEPRHAQELGPIRDALSQLQMAYAQMAGRPAGPSAGPGGQDAPSAGPGGSAGPGQEPPSRLWVPGS